MPKLSTSTSARCAASPREFDAWWTPAQLEYAEGIAGPALDQAVHDMMTDAFKGNEWISIKPDRNFSLDIPTPRNTC